MSHAREYARPFLSSDGTHPYHSHLITKSIVCLMATPSRFQPCTQVLISGRLRNLYKQRIRREGLRCSMRFPLATSMLYACFSALLPLWMLVMSREKPLCTWQFAVTLRREMKVAADKGIVVRIPSVWIICKLSSCCSTRYDASRIAFFSA